MDNATFEHLTAWCEREYSDRKVDGVRNAMVNLLESMDQDSAEYSLSHGWPHISNLLEEAP
jgi:hypothetical protein